MGNHAWLHRPAPPLPGLSGTLRRTRECGWAGRRECNKKRGEEMRRKAEAPSANPGSAPAIVQEMSHDYAGTKDREYGKWNFFLSSCATRFSASNAFDNADSYACFAYVPYGSGLGFSSDFNADMANLLNASSILKCPHGGQVSIVASTSRVTAAGSPLVTASDTFTIAGCSFNISGSPHPCVEVEWLVTDQSSQVNGALTLSEESVGMCLAADQAPQGTVLINSTQEKVSGV